MGLQCKGFHIDAFSDPQTALEKFESGKYDVLITDVRMPAMNGFELARRISKIDDKIKIFFFKCARSL